MFLLDDPYYTLPALSYFRLLLASFSGYDHPVEVTCRSLTARSSVTLVTHLSPVALLD